VVDAFTKRNHYNPCFWTALWNRTYFEAWLAGTADLETAREQAVYALNLRGDSVRTTNVDSVHFEKNLGVAEITPESAKDFCRRRYPKEYDRLSEYVTNNPETLYLDFEDILTGMENLGIYSSLMEAARIGAVDSAEHKAFLISALMIHAMRSHELMTSMTETSGVMGMEKWEYFWLLKNAWANQLVLARAAIAPTLGQWILYRTEDHRFPLPDSPVMIRRDTLMAVLSPRLLLEISLSVQQPESHWIVHDGISNSKYREFRRRAIGNAFKDILFHEPGVLEEWRSVPEYRARVKALGAPETRAELVHERLRSGT
jgi:hypothetical protein